MANSINLFSFSDYRKFLRTWLESAKAEKRSNLSQLAAAIGVHSTFLSHVLAGSKDLNLEQATVMSTELSLTKLEREYFFVLIHLERAGSEDLKNYWREKKQEIEAERNKLDHRFENFKTLTDTERGLFYSSWIYSGAFACSAIQGGQTLDQIAERLEVSREKTTEVLSFLVQTGLCQLKNGIYSIGDVHVHIGNESPFVVTHHTNWRMQAIQKMSSREKNELFFTSPMSISKKDFLKIRERLNVTIQEVIDEAVRSEAEELFCLNIDFFQSGK